MKYLIYKGGYSINNQKPEYVKTIEAANIVEAKKVCKKLGKEYSTEIANTVNINESIREGIIPADYKR